MKRFWTNVSVEQTPDGWQVALDGKPLKTQGGAAQIVPAKPLADALAEEWRAQDDTVDPAAFPLRDLADFAIDHVANDAQATIAKLLQYADTDTLCYRAGPDEPLWQRQMAVWEPLLTATEAREGVSFERISGVGYKAHATATSAELAKRLSRCDPFTLAALQTMASLAASLCIALEAEARTADGQTLFAAANLEEDWQAEQWGWDADAQDTRNTREANFNSALKFLELAEAG